MPMWTRKSSITLGGALVAQAAGMAFSSYALAAIGGALLVWVCFAYVTSRRPSFEGQQEVGNERVFEGDAVPVKARLKAHGLPFGWAEVRDPLPPQVDVTKGSNYVVVPLRRREPVIEFQATFPVRGLYAFGPVETRSLGLFSMFGQTKTLGAPAGLLVMPRGPDISEAEFTSLYPKQFLGDYSVRSPGIGSNFYALRDYTPADEMRMVNWKATARSGKLVVNQWQRETIAEVTIFLDARHAAGLGTVGQNPLVLCARAAAGLADVFLKAKNSVRLIVYGEEVRHLHLGGGDSQYYKILAELAEAEPRGDMTFGQALDRTLHLLKPRSPVWVFSSLAGDLHMAEGVAALAVEQSRCHVVAPDILKCLAGGPASPAEMAERKAEQRLAIQALRGMGAKVIEWDPETDFTLALHLAEAQV